MEVAEPKENYYSGYVKIYRSLKNKGWYNRSEAVHLWVHLIMEATHKDREYFWNGKTIMLKAGQFVTTRNKLSSETGINRSSVDRWLKVFEIEHQLSQQTTNTSRLISILSYLDYQIIEPQTSHGGATDEPQVSTKQELNKLKELNIDVPPLVVIPKNKGKFAPPTIIEFKAYFKEWGYSESVAERAWNSYDVSNWVKSNGKPVLNWKQTCQQVWFKDENKVKEKTILPSAYSKNPRTDQ